MAGEEVNPEDYAEQIAEGFRGTFRVILDSRDELLANDGPLSWFSNDEIRLVARPTKIYAQILYESYHPNLLRCALDRDRFVDKLWVGLDQEPQLALLIPAEQTDLQYGDIPMFSARPSSRHLWTSTGEQIPTALDEAPLELARGNIARLSEADLSRQLWFIRGSLATISSSKRPIAYTEFSEYEQAAPAEADQLITAAREIGDRLESIASVGDEIISWTGLVGVNDRSWLIMPLTSDLYNGLPGVALFLAYLGRISGDEHYTRLARIALHTAAEQFQETRRASTTGPGRVGAFSGDSGLIYCLTHAANLWSEPALLDQAEQLIGSLNESIERDRNFDILVGAAGYLCVLEGFYRSRPLPAALEGITRCADHLVSNA